MSKGQRGEIWEVEFRPAVGAEMRKLRPAVVIIVAAIALGVGYEA
jgi:mRNA-degrading endonuclease toxin of MazEF toxin-antitoxin module